MSCFNAKYLFSFVVLIAVVALSLMIAQGYLGTDTLDLFSVLSFTFFIVTATIISLAKEIIVAVTIKKVKLKTENKSSVSVPRYPCAIINDNATTAIKTTNENRYLALKQLIN